MTRGGDTGLVPRIGEPDRFPGRGSGSSLEPALGATATPALAEPIAVGAVGIEPPDFRLEGVVLPLPSRDSALRHEPMAPPDLCHYLPGSLRLAPDNRRMRGDFSGGHPVGKAPFGDRVSRQSQQCRGEN